MWKMCENWNATYVEIKKKHDEAYNIVQDACNEDVKENLEVALEKYRIGLEAINAVLSIIVCCPEPADNTWKDAMKMIRNVRQAKPAVEKRIDSLVRYFDEKRLKEGHPTVYSELVRTLKELKSSPEDTEMIRELVFCCENVKFYTIKQDGTVTLTMDNTVLEIWKYTKVTPEASSNHGTFCLQVMKTAAPVLATVMNGQEIADNPHHTDILLTYPLLPGVSPCFRTRFGAIILPDLGAPPSADATVGIEVEGPPDEVLLEILDEILKCVYRQPEDEPSKRAPRSLAMTEKMTKGAFYISQGLIRGSQKTGELITYTTPYLISRMAKAPLSAPPVSTGVRTSVEVAKTVTGTAASVTGFMAQKLGSATMALGRFIAPRLQEQGSRLLSHSLGMSQADATEKVSDALTVAAGAVEAFSTVYLGLEESASILGRSLSSNSVKVIEHKYGPSAANLASSTFETAGNMFALSQNVKLMTPKGLAKKTAKSAGKALVEDFQPQSGPSRVD
ncbi:protein spartin [Phlebotomus argentipes]|uniref:protein spartin n=1 Tax=Phlebotomus argentipes TaxID=94469 RepID=UPI0028934E9E|nr:protein spartin [Phlebotomus argentipes]